MSTLNPPRPTTFYRETPSGTIFPLSSVATGAPPVFASTQQLGGSYSANVNAVIPLFSGAGFQTITVPVPSLGLPAITLVKGQNATLTYGANPTKTPSGIIISAIVVLINYAGQKNTPGGTQTQMFTGPGSYGTPSLSIELTAYAPAAAATATVPINVWAHLIGSVIQQ